MTKRISLILVLTLVLSLCAACAAAPTEITQTLTFDDGSYMVITMKEEGSTYTTRIEAPDQLSQITGAPDSYSLQPLSQYEKWDGNAGYKSQKSDNLKIGNHYLDWIETEDGNKLPVWRDKYGNMLYDTKFATKYCSYYSADNQLLWTMSVTGMFKRNSVDHYCEVVSGNITVWETDSWYVIMEYVADEADSASYTVQFGRKNLGVTIAEPSYTLTLTRDIAGNFH